MNKETGFILGGAILVIAYTFLVLYLNVNSVFTQLVKFM